MLHRSRISMGPAAAAAFVAFVGLASPSVSAQCVVGTNAALAFDGVDDSATVPGNAFAGISTALTFEAWVKTTTNQNRAFITNASNFPNGAGASNGIIIGLGFPAAGRLRIGGYSGGSSFNAQGQTSVATGAWVHVAVVYSAPTVTFYRDGVLDGSSAFVASLPATSSGVTRIGNFTNQLLLGVSGAALSGELDEIRIWNVARTQTQIQSTMNVGLGGGEPGLVGYWRFDEGNGQTAFNSAAATGAALNASLGENAFAGADDPTWASTALPPIPYCPPCPSPPCGQVNSTCASLTVNGVGAGAQGPFNVVVPPGGSLTFDWSGPPLQPYFLVSTSNLVPGQPFAPPALVVDVNIGSFQFLFGALDPVWGPLFTTNASGTGTQTFGVPAFPLGITMNVQGLIYDLANTCSGGVGLATTASFAIQL
jgi:hypothetical protein